jgi:hypothetical protein
MLGLFVSAGLSKWVADLPLVSQFSDFNISPAGFLPYWHLDSHAVIGYRTDYIHY